MGANGQLIQAQSAVGNQKCFFRDLSSYICDFFFILIFKNFIYLWIFGFPGLHCCEDFSLVVASRGYSVIVVPEFLIVVASLVVEQWL